MLAMEALLKLMLAAEMESVLVLPAEVELKLAADLKPEQHRQ